MERVAIYLLGSPRIELNGLSAETDTRKAVALAAYLAVEGASQSRDTLVDLFWPESDASRGRAALRRTLSALNKALGSRTLATTRRTIGLEFGPEDFVDVAEFDRLIASSTSDVDAATVIQLLTSAVRMYTGDFLAGFSLRDSPEFDDWQFTQSEVYRAKLATALDRLERAHSDLAQRDEAIGYVRRRLALDPLHEPAHRRLIELHALAGDRAAAMRQYQECVRVLDRELGVAPLDETRRAYEAVREGTFPMSAPAVALTLSPSTLEKPREGQPSRPDGAHSLPMVGRSREMAVALEAYQAIDETGRLLVIEGEAGIGKTRLAEVVVNAARSTGASAVEARCYRGEANLAYGPVIAALRNALDDEAAGKRVRDVPGHWLAEAGRLVPDLAVTTAASTPQSMEGPGAQSRFIEGIAQVLSAACGPRGVLFLDDVHRADDSSIDVVAYLLRRLQERPICVLLTWRREEIEYGHSLLSALAECQRGGSGTLASLSRLDSGSVEELVLASKPSVTDVDALSRRLFQETEGLPLFVVEYLSAAPALGDWEMPVGVRQLLESKVGALGETARQVLGAAAVIGRSFDFDTVKSAAGRTDEETTLAMEELTARGVVAESPPDPASPIYDFTHDRVRTFVYGEMSLVRKRLLHRRVAQSLDSHGGRPTQAGEIARHYHLGGEEAKAADYYKVAGDGARAVYANAEALHHYRSALALGWPDTALLHEAIGDLETLQGNYGVALDSYSAASATEERVQIELKVARVRHRRGEWDRAEMHYRVATDSLDSDGSDAVRARAYADWSLMENQRGTSDTAYRLASQALDLARSSGDSSALAYTYNLLGILAKNRLDLAEAKSHLEHSLSLAEEMDDVGAQAAALNNLALVLAPDDSERAIALATRALELCTSQGDRHHEAAIHNNLADLYHATGDSEQARGHLEKAVTLFAEIGSKGEELHPEIWKLVEW